MQFRKDSMGDKQATASRKFEGACRVEEQLRDQSVGTAVSQTLQHQQGEVVIYIKPSASFHYCIVGGKAQVSYLTELYVINGIPIMVSYLNSSSESGPCNE